MSEHHRRHLSDDPGEVHRDYKHSPPQKYRYTCSSCPFGTSTRCSMVKHRKRHVAAEFSCSKCNMPFRSKNHQTAHMRTVHGVGRVARELRKQCGMCPYTTLHSSDIARHRKKHTNTRFACRFCNYPFATPHMMEAHIKKTHKFASGEKDMSSHRHELDKNGNKAGSRNTPDTHKKGEHRKNHAEAPHVHADLGHRHRHTTDDKVALDKETGHGVFHRRHTETKLYEDGELCPRTPGQHHSGKKHVRHTTSEDKVPINDKVKTDERKHSKQSHRLKDRHKLGVKTKDHKSNCTNIYTSPKKSISLVEIEGRLNVNTPDQSATKRDRVETITTVLGDDSTIKALRCLKCGFLTTKPQLIDEHVEKHEHQANECSVVKIKFKQGALDEDVDSADDNSNSDDIECDTSDESLKEPSEIELTEIPGTSLETPIDNTDVDTEMKCAFCSFKTETYHVLKEHITCHIEKTPEKVSCESSGDVKVLKAVDKNYEEEEMEDHQYLSSDCDTGNSNDRDTTDNDDDEDDNKDDSNDDDAKNTDENDACVRAIEAIKCTLSVTSANSTSSTESLEEYTCSEQCDQQYNDDVSYENEEENITESEQFEAKDNKGSPEGSVEEMDNIVSGRLDEEEFRKTLKFYRMMSTDGGGHTYECLVCIENTLFQTSRSISQHFKKHHKELRKRICLSCPYCSKPFPRHN